MATVTPGVPFDGQSLGNSKPQIRNTLTAIENATAVNHFPVNSANWGKHQFVEMPVLGARPTLAASEGGLYSKNVTSTVGSTISPELFWSVNVGGPEFQVTARSTNTTPQNTTVGWTFLPGGMLMQWGFATGVGTTPVQQTFAIPFAVSGGFGPNITTGIGSGSTNVTAIVTPVDNTKFNLKSTGTGVSIYWQAIGSA